MSSTGVSISSTRRHPIMNVDRDMENQLRMRNARARNHINPRDRLFHALFIKIGHVYSRIVPKKCRVMIEVIVLMKALCLFTMLSYLHFSFGRKPLNCLNTTADSWPRDGVLRVQIQPEYRIKKQIPRFYSREENRNLFHPCHDTNMFNSRHCATLAKSVKAFYDYEKEKYNVKSQCYRMNLSDFMTHQPGKHWKHFQSYEYVAMDKTGNVFSGFSLGDIINESNLMSFYDLYLIFSDSGRQYIFEYAREFGFLRLSQETRTRLKIPVKVVTLDPTKEKCFGDKFSSFVLTYFLGYDDIIMNSIKKIADVENNTGYMLNVVTGDNYRFVSWSIGRSSYFISLFLMFLFTISISTLLRYCHEQVFFFILQILRVSDMNVMLAFPIAPLFTVILSLVGMETIMSEYFNDTTISFYIILLVWAVDQFDTICCHTVISQRYWLRFFYLYHFVFYAYHYRFNGQYSSIALASTWFFIQHSMLYFFHNYELPAIEEEIHGRRDEEAYLDEAVQMIVEGIEMVAAEQQQNRNQDERVQNNQVEGENEPINADNNTRVRELATTNNGNRIFVFSGDGPFVQMVREFIRQIHERLNVAPVQNAENETNPEHDREAENRTDINTEEPTNVDENTNENEGQILENINDNIETENTIEDSPLQPISSTDLYTSADSCNSSLTSDSLAANHTEDRDISLTLPKGRDVTIETISTGNQNIGD